MSDSKLKPYADLKVKTRTYIDKDGKEKGVWLTIGTLFSSPHGSNLTIKIDAIPTGDWNGFVSIFKREQPENAPEQDEVQL